MHSNEDNLENEEDFISTKQMPLNENIYFDNNECYSCSKCSSNIEILSIDSQKSKITFKCLNKDKINNHHIQTMSINEYIKNMEKNTYLFDKCSICGKEQNSSKNFPIFKYCIKCKGVICNECEDIHKYTKCNNKILINNNEKGIKCLLHPKNNNVEYCFECHKHICNKCIESKKHYKHKTKSLLDIMASEEEKKNLQKFINSLKEKKDNIENEKNNKINILNNRLKKEEERIENDLKEKLNLNDINKNNELSTNDKKKKEELEEAKKKYDKIVKEIENKYNTNEKKFKK